MLEKRNFSKRSNLANDYKLKTRQSKPSIPSNDLKSEKSLVKRTKKDTHLEELERMIRTDKRQDEEFEEEQPAVKSCMSSSNQLPPRTIAEEDEDEIIAHLEAIQRQRLEEDPMRELDEALMDRTTASHNRKHKIITINSQSIKHRSDNNSSSVAEVVSKQDLSESKESCPSSAPKRKESEVQSNNSSRKKRCLKQSQKTTLKKQKQVQKVESIKLELEQEPERIEEQS